MFHRQYSKLLLHFRSLLFSTLLNSSPLLYTPLHSIPLLCQYSLVSIHDNGDLRATRSQALSWSNIDPYLGVPCVHVQCLHFDVAPRTSRRKTSCLIASFEQRVTHSDLQLTSPFAHHNLRSASSPSDFPTRCTRHSMPVFVQVRSGKTLFTQSP